MTLGCVVSSLLQGAYFYRIIYGFIDQGGVDVDSVFGGEFKDDDGGLKLKHDRKGLLSMANHVRAVSSAHYAICFQDMYT